MTTPPPAPCRCVVCGRFCAEEDWPYCCPACWDVVDAEIAAHIQAGWA